MKQAEQAITLAYGDLSEGMIQHRDYAITEEVYRPFHPVLCSRHLPLPGTSVSSNLSGAVVRSVIHLTPHNGSESW